MLLSNFGEFFRELSFQKKMITNVKIEYIQVWVLVIETCLCTGPRSRVGNVPDCRSRGREFDPGPAPYFRGD